MRPFPRTARRRTAAALTVVALALGSSVPIAMADDLKDKQRQVEKKVGHAKEDVQESSARVRRAQARLADARTRLDGARARLATARGQVQVAAERDAQMQAELEAAEAELDAAEAELASGREQMGDQRDAVVATVTDFYQEGDPELLAFSSFLQSETAADLTRRDGLRDAIVGRETRAFDELHAAEVLLEVRKRQVAEARDSVEDKRRAAAANLEEKRALESRAVDARTEVAGLVDTASSAKAKADRLRAADMRKLRQLEAESQRISEMLRRRAAAALRRARASSARPTSRDGFLDYPVDGYVTSPFGYRTHPIYGYYSLHDGVDFGGGCGKALKAAAPGRVVSSYWSDVYGRRLIVVHGAVGGVGLATIYNHASSYTVGVGAQVARGQTIGYMGNSGWSTGCHLHFSVTANGRSVDPQNWF